MLCYITIHTHGGHPHQWCDTSLFEVSKPVPLSQGDSLMLPQSKWIHNTSIVPMCCVCKYTYICCTNIIKFTYVYIGNLQGFENMFLLAPDERILGTHCIGPYPHDSSVSLQFAPLSKQHLHLLRSCIIFKAIQSIMYIIQSEN